MQILTVCRERKRQSQRMIPSLVREITADRTTKEQHRYVSIRGSCHFNCPKVSSSALTVGCGSPVSYLPGLWKVSAILRAFKMAYV